MRIAQYRELIGTVKVTLAECIASEGTPEHTAAMDRLYSVAKSLRFANPKRLKDSDVTEWIRWSVRADDYLVNHDRRPEWFVD